MQEGRHRQYIQETE